jgi:endonuclease/exonuclease/phosphatase family metal-dependent hydrolase
MDGKLNLNRIADVIKESGADIAGLNELDRYFLRRSCYIDQLNWLSDKLNMNHAFGPAVTLRSKYGVFPRQYGNGLLSQYPIVCQTNHTFDSMKGIFEGRALLEVDMQIQETLLKILVTHLSLSPFKRNKQIDYILKKLEEVDLPVILLGDYNMRPGTKQWKKITNVLTDVCDSYYNDPCNTFPAARPKVQLDYIFVSDHFHIDSVQFISKHLKASDHLPIKTTLRLK